MTEARALRAGDRRRARSARADDPPVSRGRVVLPIAVLYSLSRVCQAAVFRWPDRRHRRFVRSGRVVVAGVSSMRPKQKKGLGATTNCVMIGATLAQALDEGVSSLPIGVKDEEHNRNSAVRSGRFGSWL
jgi:hypothetical protein